MSTVDLGAIRTALAAQQTTGNTGVAATADASGLDAIGSLPAIKVVSATTVAINEGRGGRNFAQTESREVRVVGVLLVDASAGKNHAIARAEPYVEGAFAACRTGFGLGLDYVEDSWLDSAEIGEVDYLGETFHGAVLNWVIWVRQTDLNRTA